VPEQMASDAIEDIADSQIRGIKLQAFLLGIV
jgi:hypothetical protein